MDVRRDPALQVRALDAVVALCAAALTFGVLAASGYFMLPLSVLVLVVGVLLLVRPGRSRWVGAGVLMGVVALGLAAAVHFE